MTTLVQSSNCLPFEVWDLVLRNNFDITALNARYATIDVTRYTTLANLCLVSTYTRDVAEPLLYHNFSTRHGIPFQKWAHNIISNPRLAHHVLELDLNFVDSGTPHRSRLDYAYNSFFFELAKSKGMSENYGDLSSQMHSWIPLVLLLPTLPNPIRLMLRMGMISREVALCFDGMAASRIREFRLDTTTYDRLASLHRIPKTGPTCLLKSPGLKYVHLHGPTVLRTGVDEANPQPVRLSNNEDTKWLRITNSSPDPGMLSYLLPAFPNLEVLEYHIHRQGPCTIDYYPPSPLEHLSPLWKTLRVLSLDLAMSNLQPWHSYPIRSLAEFVHLEELRIESMAILPRNWYESSQQTSDYRGHFEPQEDDILKDYFPRSLRKLRITHVFKNMEKPLMELADNLSEWLPSLVEIQIDLGRNGLETSTLYNDLENVLIVRELLKNVNAERQDILSSRKLRSLGMARTIHSDLRWLDRAGYHDPRIRELDVEIPASFVYDKDDLSSIDDYVTSHGHIRHLPAAWQTIVARFNAAGVRVKLSHSTSTPYCQEIDLEQPFAGWIGVQQYHPVVNFDSEAQMAKWLWVPHFQKERPRLLGRAYQQ